MNLKKKIKKFLKWSEKYTKTDMTYLVKGGSWLGINQIVSILSGFGLSIVYANFFPKQGFGFYKFVLSVGSILSLFTLKGIDIALEKDIAQKKDVNLKNLLKHKVKWGIIGSLISLVISFYYYFQGNTELSLAFIVLTVFLPFYYSSTFYTNVLTGKKLFDKLAKYRIKEIVFSFLVVSLTVFLSNDPVLLLIAFFSSWSVTRYYHIYKIQKEFEVNKHNENNTVTQYGKHLSVIDSIGTIGNNLEKMMLWFVVGAESVAIFVFAKKPAKLIKEVLKKISALAFPKFSEKNKEELKRTLLSKIAKLIGIVSVVVIIYILLSPYLYKLFFPKYTDAIFYTQIYAITRAISPIGQFLKKALESQEQTEALYKIKIGTQVTKITLIGASVSVYGILGLVISLIIVKIIQSILYIYYFKRM